MNDAPSPIHATHWDGRPGTVDPDSGKLWVDNDSGGMEAVTNWASKPNERTSKHDANLAIALDQFTIDRIGSDLKRSIEADDRARHEYLATIEEATEQLGLTIERPGVGGGGVEG